jgi:transposase
MMGQRKSEQGQLFYSFDLDAVVPGDHLARRIAAVLDLSWLRRELAPHYSHTGRPSIDPELMIRMLVIGYVFAIRSERALCREVQLNLAYRWFCGLGIEDKIPDHSTFTRARNERFCEHDIFRQVFERVVSACIKARLVGGIGFAVDASLIAADANKCGSTPGDERSHDIDPATVERAGLSRHSRQPSLGRRHRRSTKVRGTGRSRPRNGRVRSGTPRSSPTRTTISSTSSSASSWTSKPRAPFAKQKSALRR